MTSWLRVFLIGVALVGQLGLHTTESRQQTTVPTAMSDGLSKSSQQLLPDRAFKNPSRDFKSASSAGSSTDESQRPAGQEVARPGVLAAKCAIKSAMLARSAGDRNLSPIASECWTEWFDRDNPSGKGDFEVLIALRRENPEKICKNPLQMEVQTTSGLSVEATGNMIAISDTTTGFVCRNADQRGGACQDYRVRFMCDASFCAQTQCWTDWFDRDNPSGTGDWENLSALRSENPEKICDNPLQIQVQTTSGISVAATGNVIAASDTTTGFICKNSDQKNGMCYDYRVRFMCPTSFCSPKECWTDWFDRDDPSGSGDWEILRDLRAQYPGKICNDPLQIDVQTTTGLIAGATGNVISVADVTTGFVCRNSEQKQGWCHDYRVRFMCPAEFCSQQVCWTKWYDLDNPSGNGDFELLHDLRRVYPGQICERPLHIDVVTIDTKTPAAFTGQTFEVFSPTGGFSCRNRNQRGGFCRDYRVRFGCPCRCHVV